MSKIAFAVVLTLTISLTNAQTPDQLFSKYLAFLGGEPQLRTIHSRIDSGAYNYGGIEFPFVSYAKASDNYKYIVSFKGKYFAQAFDGKEGWKIDVFKGETKKTILTGNKATAMANEADVQLESPFIDYKKKGYTAQPAGADTIDNIPCLRVRLIKDDTAAYSFDPNTGTLLKKVAISKNSELDGGILETYYLDYREVNGIKFPFKTVNKIKGQTVLTITIRNIDLNPPISNEIFSAASQP